MTQKTNLLIIADYNRQDYVDLFYACKGYFNFYFLYHTSKKHQTSEYYKTYGQAIFWQDYADVFSLLAAVKPKKVIFFYIDTYNQVILNLACRHHSIPTYQLEHGLRADYVLGFDPATSPKLPVTLFQKTKIFLNYIKEAPFKIKNRLFLLNSIRLFPAKDAAFVKEYIRVRKYHNFLETSRLIPPAERTAENYISFSRNIYRIHQKEDALPDDKKVHFIGVPYYDHLAQTTAADPIKAILFIDQPLAEANLLGWTPQHKTAFTAQLAEICQHLGYSLLVKPHPVQDLTVWRRLCKSFDIKIVSDEEVIKLASHLRIVFGFYSTYLLPFAALEHTAVITYDNHPSGSLKVSKIFTEAGVGHTIVDLEELNSLVPGINALHQQQLPKKHNFIEDWLYKFDGKSGERLRRVLLGDYTIL